MVMLLCLFMIVSQRHSNSQVHRHVFSFPKNLTTHGVLQEAP